MKRYWKIITICLVTVVVIGTFYIQSSLAVENIVVEFEKVSGDENEAKGLEINADYVVGDIHQSLLITHDETTNVSNRSMIQEFTGMSPERNKLIEKYGKFMRSKDWFPTYFYEDDQVVAYVSIEGKGINASPMNSFFDIDVMDIKSKESTSMELDIPNMENYHWVDVIDVQLLNGNLKVIARGSRTSGEEDLIAYTINIADQKVVNNEVIHSSLPVKDGWSEVRILNDTFSSHPQNYILFRVETYEYYQGDAENIVASDVMVYDIEKNQTKKVDVPEELSGVISNSTISGSTIFVPNQVEDGVIVEQYDIEAEKWGNKQTFAVNQSEDAKDAPAVKLLNEKLYIISSTNDGYILSIGDVNTGDSLYEGKLQVKNQKDKESKLYIFEIREAM
ncbi:hypothetical protein [Ferdinandcohnia sp. Marseille-Q9671]